MKKAGFAFIAVVVIGMIYYFSHGSSQLIQELKTVVDTQLQSLQKEGFAVEERTVGDEEEHFVLVFDDTDKIAEYANKDRLQITQDETASLKGLKIGVDIDYLKDTYSALSFDLYPVALPSRLTSGELTPQDRETLAKVDALFKDKTFLVHIDINKMLGGFKGFIKDIDKTFVENGQKAVLNLQSFTFEGDIKDNRIASLQQQLKTLRMYVENEVNIETHDVQSAYQLHGATVYDTTATYNIGKLIFEEAQKTSIAFEKLDIHAKSDLSNGLVKSAIATRIASIDVKDNGKQLALQSLDIESTVSNFDIQSFEKLKDINTLKEEQINAIVQKILSSGLSFEISRFSIADIQSEQKTLGGFDLNAKLNIDKSIDLAMLQINPITALSSLDADLKLSLSQPLFTFVSQQPDALLAMMMFQPKDENGKKIYLLELKKGTLTVNGVPMM